jgi:hypothetical protein
MSSQTFFHLFAIGALIHSLFSWFLLLAVRSDEKIRTELFGSMKTVALGPKTMRLKHLFTRSAPEVVAQSSLNIRNLFWFARWSGRISFLFLLGTVIATILHAMSVT